MKYAYFIFVALLLACSGQKKDDKPAPVAVIGGSKEIYLQDIDRSVDQELYNILQRVYALRKTALDGMIQQYIIAEEAKKANQSEEEFIRKNIIEKVTDNSIDEYIRIRGIENRGIPSISNTFESVKTGTSEGRKMIREILQTILKDKLVDSLKKVYAVNISLSPPKPPLIHIDTTKLLVHYRGNLSSKVTFWEISDLECPSCHDGSRIYQEIYEKYKDRLRFAFVHFSGSITTAALASEAAAKQGRFWEMHDAIFKYPPTTSPGFYHYLSDSLKLDKSQFAADLRDSTVVQQIRSNIRYLQGKNFYTTPALLINSTLVLDPFSGQQIEETIKTMISE